MDDWDLLSDDDGLVDFYVHIHQSVSPTNFYHFQDDYFSPKPSIVPVPVPIHFNPTLRNDPEDDEEVTKLPIDSTLVPPEKAAIRALPEAGGDDDAASNNQVFVKMKETDQFVDMKMDSPKGTIATQIEDRSDAVSETIEAEAVAVGWEEGGRANIWRWGFTGIGALCSFGVAAACIIILGSHEKQQQSHNHKARFQIYATDKRIKQVVHQATRLNEVISGTRGGVQLARAHVRLL